MRVAIMLEQLLARVPGGTGRFARELVLAAAADAAQGDVIDGWTAWHPRAGLGGLAGVGGPHRLALGRRMLSEAWSRGVGPSPSGADIVHAPTLLLPPRRRAPLIVTIHDAVPWTHPQTLTPRGVAWHQRMGQRAAEDADLITVDTWAVADALRGHLDLGDRVRVLGAGWSLAAPVDAIERRQRMGLAPRYLVFVGTVEPRKGLDVLLDSMLHVDLPLVVVGPSGWGGIDIVAEVERRGATDRVLALGRLEDEDLASVVSGAVSLVSPSRAEGFGLPLLEAMALGTPVVASDDPALVEVGEGAPLHVAIGDSVALAQALCQVVADPALREQMRARGLEVAGRRTWRREAQRLWGLYYELVG